MDYSTGETLASRFELKEYICEGGMGQIFRAKDLVTQRECAVKVLHGILKDYDVAKKCMENEAEIAISLAALRPDLFPAIYAVMFETRNETFFIAMEFIQGRDLYSIVKENGGRLSVFETVRIGLQILKAMQTMYLHDVIMRDVKLENVIVSSNGLVKITDFGIAKQRRNENETPGTVFGTPYYVAPEYILGGTSDHRADLYSFGVLLYRLLAGKFPFNEFSPSRTFYAHTCRLPPTLPADVPEELRMIIMRLLEKFPADRYQTPQKAAEELAAFAVSMRPNLRTQEPYYSLLGCVTDKFTVTEASVSQSAIPSVSARRNGSTPASLSDWLGSKFRSILRL